MMKLRLSLAQTQRNLAGVVLDAFIVPADHALVANMSQQTSAYADQVKAAGKDHALAPPHIWAMGA
eukprot:2587922-Pyramimonas_sp.AAC.1